MFRKFSIATSVLLFSYTITRAQENILIINSFLPTDSTTLNLLRLNKEIRDNTILNESVVDLVNVGLTDSILKRKTERHQVPIVGGFTRFAGRRWETINWRKEKYVGTARNGFRIPGGESLTEYDVNINLVPHLKRYIDLAFKGFAKQKEIGRGKKKVNYGAPPFVYPDNNTSLDGYDLHCELTPPRPFRSMINELVYPIIPGNSATKHHHFGDENFTMGLYGAFISDCNHKCHPEIHPYEWLWWLNVHPSLDAAENSKTWVFGLFREGSNRFPHWSTKPRTGEISIPFVFPAGKDLTIEFDHLVFSEFNETGFSQLTIPSDAHDFNFQSNIFTLMGDGSNTRIIFKTNMPLIQNGIKWWFSSLNYDKEKNLVSGKLHIATSVDDLYTAKVEFSH